MKKEDSGLSPELPARAQEHAEAASEGLPLLPCPFCGSAAALAEAEPTGWVVECTHGACRASTNIRFSVKEDARPLVVAQWNRRADDECCMACGDVMRDGDAYLSDVSGGCLHAACCGPERESYAHLDGEPLGPDEAIPEPLIWAPLGRLATLEAALAFYRDNWRGNMEGDPETPGLSRCWQEPTDQLLDDAGRKAREALSTGEPSQHSLSGETGSSGLIPSQPQLPKEDR